MCPPAPWLGSLSATLSVSLSIGLSVCLRSVYHVACSATWQVPFLIFCVSCVPVVCAAAHLHVHCLHIACSICRRCCVWLRRARAAEMFFESFGVPAMYISMQAVLSL